MLNKSIVIVIMVTALWIPTGGCGLTEAISSGPRMMATTAETAQGAAKLILQTYQPDATHVDVSGDVSDPRYRVQTFIGAGTYVDLVMSLEGADLDFGVNSAGGAVEVDQATRERILTLIGSGKASEAELKAAIAELLKAGADRLSTDEPENVMVAPAPLPVNEAASSE